MQRWSRLRGVHNSSTLIEPLVFLVCALIVTVPPKGISSGVPSLDSTAKGATGLGIVTSSF